MFYYASYDHVTVTVTNVEQCNNDVTFNPNPKFRKEKKRKNKKKTSIKKLESKLCISNNETSYNLNTK